MPDQSFAICFVHSSRFIVYKHDSHIGCAPCNSQFSYMCFHLSCTLPPPTNTSIKIKFGVVITADVGWCVLKQNIIFYDAVISELVLS